MKNFVGLLILLFTLISCDRSWTEKEKKEFTGGCISRSAGELGDSLARVYCQCLLQKVVEKYPNANDAGYIKYDASAAQIARDCRNNVIK